MSDPDRIAEILQDWHDRRARGRSVDMEKILREHPDLAEDLRDRLAALDALDRAFPRAAELSDGVPRRIGDFRILREIDRGGMGVVYEAEQTSMRRKVALKVLSLAITGTPQAVKRFQREAQAAGRLHHTNIVPVHAMGQHAGHWYYAMELVEGRPLSKVVSELRARSGRPTEEGLARLTGAAGRSSTDLGSATGTGTRAYFVRLAEMFAGVAEALDLAHQERVIHRDIKPSNLLLDVDGTLKIVDFGLARTEQDGPSMTMTGDLLGTPAYMSPEQAMAKRIKVDHRTDIYSLGATLYEVLTLKPPFEGRNLHDLCSQIIAKDPVLPRRRDHRIPRDLETIVLKAMEKDRGKRYQSAGEMARDLRRFTEGVAIHARRIGPVGLAWRRVRRHKVRAALVTAVVLLAIGVFAAAQRAARETERRKNLEYAKLCARGHELLGQTWGHEGVDTDAQEAHRLFDRALVLAPDQPDIYLWRAIARKGLKKRLDDIDEARANGLPPRTYHLARAWAFERRERTEEAENELRRADDYEKGAPIDSYFEARLLAARGKPDQARQLLSSVIQSSSQPSAARYLALRYRGMLRRRAGDLAGALSDWQRIRGVGDASMPLRIRIASLWREMGNEAEASLALDSALDAARRDGAASTWRSLCHACSECGQQDWLYRTTQEALAQHPDSIHILILRARAVAAAGNLEEALDVANRAVRNAPDIHLALETRGGVLRRLGRYAAAVEDYNEALRIRRCRPSLYWLAFALSRLERYEEALDPIEHILRRKPGSVETWRLRAIVFHELGQHEHALASATEVVQLGGRSASDRYLMAIAHWKLGNNERARAWYDQAVAEESDDPEPQRFRAEAEDLLGLR